MSSKRGKANQRGREDATLSPSSIANDGMWSSLVISMHSEVSEASTMQLCSILGKATAGFDETANIVKQTLTIFLAPTYLESLKLV